MTTALVLAAALLLALLGGWGTARLLGRLDLDPGERLALTLALFPAALGLAAFAGLLLGRPGALLPTLVCLALGALGWACRGRSRPAGAPDRWPHTRRSSSHAARVRCAAPTPSPLASPRPALPTSSTEPLGCAASPRHAGEVDMAADPSPHQHGAGGRWREVRPDVVAIVLFGAGSLATTLLTPLSAGALRFGDWVAHWFLVLVYLGLPLPDLRPFTNRVGNFGVIARPPLYNLEGGLLVGQLDFQFWPFQLTTPLLALAVAAAGVLWARAIGGARAAWVAAALIGLSPFLLQNAAYPWSKMVAAGLVLLFLLLIRAAVLARRPGRCRQTFVLAAWCAGLGYLAHQTTLFYVLPTLLWLVWRRPRPLVRRPIGWTFATWALAGLAGLAAVAPWQGWVLAQYGLRETLEANPAWFGADVSETLGDWLLKGAVAAVGTLVPLPALAALMRGSSPTVDQLLRFQLAVLTGALGASGCWLLARRLLHPPAAAPASGQRAARPRLVVGAEGHGRAIPGLLRRPPWLALVVLSGFFGQVLLQPNWHDTGDAADSMTPIVVLGLAYVAREAVRLGPAARRLFVGLVLAELAVYLGLWCWWAFGSAWTRDQNAVLGARYGLDHLRAVWPLATPVGAALLALGLVGSAALLWRATDRSVRSDVQTGRP